MPRALPGISLVICLVAPLSNAADIDIWRAVLLGREHDESVQIARKAVEEVRLAKRISSAALLPQLSVSASANHTENSGLLKAPVSGGGNSVTKTERISLTQTIWDEQQFSNYAAAKKNLKLAHLENLKAISTNTINVTEAYLDVLSAKSNLEIARGNVTGVEAHKKVVETLFSIHESTILDLTETLADLNLAEVSVITAENDLANSRQRLIVFIGDNAYELTPVASDLDISAEPSGMRLDEWLNIAGQKNYDLQIARVRLELAKINIKRAKLDFAPNASLNASWSRSRNPDSPIASARDDTSRMVAVTVEIPIYRGGGTWARLQQAQVAYDRQLLRISQQTKRLKQQMTTLHQNRRSLQKRIVALQSLVASERKKLSATQDGFERGDRTSQEVLDAQNLLVKSEINLINAIHAYILSELQLKHATGVLSLKDIEFVNQSYFGSG